MKYIETLAARRRFGMRPGLETISALCAALGDPQKRLSAVHVAGTNGKGAVCSMLHAALGGCLYTSPHLVRLAERFTVGDCPADAAEIERAAAEVEATGIEATFFEALTAVAFLVFASSGHRRAVLECGLGGRLDATNVCVPEICAIARVGLDHCAWLGNTVEEIAAEKGGIAKRGVPLVLGRNSDEVRRVVEKCAAAAGAPFVYAPDVASEDDIPEGFPLAGRFNRENAVTAIAVLRTMGRADAVPLIANAAWPGRFQRVGDFLVDGAHNPPAAAALVAAVAESFPGARLPLVAGFCSDKDVASTLRALSPVVSKAYAVATCNPRTLAADATAAAMREAGMDAEACGSLREAMEKSRAGADAPTLVCGSLFLAGEALVALGALPPPEGAAPEPSEALAATCRT